MMTLISCGLPASAAFLFFAVGSSAVAIDAMVPLLPLSLALSVQATSCCTGMSKKRLAIRLRWHGHLRGDERQRPVWMAAHVEGAGCRQGTHAYDLFRRRSEVGLIV
ncbi:hypothetical protein [Burkholderia cenocepacia]|uniref:hypothetical protein n=1 Tax=Burkholderia cenocepacia TaxID=95486 RepID=UPI0012B717EF|nr:hypothetical protein [Burkholderia cenocepacia]